MNAINRSWWHTEWKAQCFWNPGTELPSIVSLQSMAAGFWIVLIMPPFIYVKSMSWSPPLIASNSAFSMICRSFLSSCKITVLQYHLPEGSVHLIQKFEGSNLRYSVAKHCQCVSCLWMHDRNWIITRNSLYSWTTLASWPSSSILWALCGFLKYTSTQCFMVYFTLPHRLQVDFRWTL